MQTLDPAGEFLRVSEHYRQISDAELLILAGQSSELTEVAQQALASEISHRKLKLQPENPPAPPAAPPVAAFTGWDSRSAKPEPSPASSEATDPYSEERKLVELCTVWSLGDALQVQTLLDRAGIPFFMGPEKAAGVDTVTSNFTKGVSVKIMQIGMPWATQAMQNYTPANEPKRKPEQELRELPVRCPQCHSAEVIFEGLTTEPAPEAHNSSPKYKWTCDACGCQWEDDGIAEEE